MIRTSVVTLFTMSNSKEIIDVDSEENNNNNNNNEIVLTVKRSRVVDDDHNKQYEKAKKIREEYNKKKEGFHRNHKQKITRMKLLLPDFIMKHIEYCNANNSDRFPIREGPSQQFRLPYIDLGRAGIDPTNDECLHYDTLMGCRRHVFCIGCIMQLESDQLLSLDEGWSEKIEKLYDEGKPSPWKVPPPPRFLLHEDLVDLDDNTVEQPLEKKKTYPQFKDFNCSYMRYGIVKYNDVKHVEHICAMHCLPYGRYQNVGKINNESLYNELHFF